MCLLLASLAYGETLEEAVRNLARKISVRLAPGETPHVVMRNLSSLGTNDVAKAREAFEKALRHPPSRTAHPVDVALTISQNLRGFLLVAELQRDSDRVVEMAVFRPEAAPHSTRVALERALLREQENPMLDVALLDDRMLVLETDQLVLYARRGSNWERLDARPLAGGPILRDPRGRLQLSEASLTADLPGFTCRGAWTPALDVNCQPGSADFTVGGEPVRLAPGRNTLEAPGWPPLFSLAHLDDQGRPVYLLAELDGRIHLYDADRKSIGLVDSWGSDALAVESGCGAGRELLVTAGGDRETNDSLTAYEMIDRKPVQSSDPIEFPGPLTALWPSSAGASAIARNLNSGRYAAYSITIRCNY